MAKQSPPPTREQLPVTVDKSGKGWASVPQSWIRWFNSIQENVNPTDATNHNDLAGIKGSAEGYHLSSGEKSSLLTTSVLIDAELKNIPDVNDKYLLLDSTASFGIKTSTIGKLIVKIQAALGTSTAERGIQGVPGEDGLDGEDGRPGQSITGLQGPAGQFIRGEDGLDGEDGFPMPGIQGTSAGSITNTPAGTIAATNVQAALNELDAEKALLAGSATQAFSASSLTTPVVIGGSSTTQTLTYKTTTGIGAAGADHIFKVGNNGATEAVRILNNGFVGINKPLPVVALDVVGAISATGVAATNTTGLALGGTTTGHNQIQMTNNGGITYLGLDNNLGTNTGAAYTTYLNSLNPIHLQLGGVSIAVTTSTGLAVTGAISSTTTIRTGGYTVATLPAGVSGDRAYVTDATAPLYNTALTGGGTVVIPVFRNATVWVSA